MVCAVWTAQEKQCEASLCPLLQLGLENLDPEPFMLATYQTVRFKCVYGATNPTISQKAPRFDTEVFHQFIYLLCTSSLHSLVWIDQLLLGHMTPIILFVLLGFQCILLDKLLYGKSLDTLLLCVQSTILVSFPTVFPSVQGMR